MGSCPDCGLLNPDDLHTCPEYEANQKKEQAHLTIPQEMMILRMRVEELERRVAQHTNQLKPWNEHDPYKQT